jgi:ADP-heptose:LPS heptosyltransferase
LDIQKILILRFSSIGDIVLTTPVLRCVKEQIPGVQIHYLTKDVFRQVIRHNPHIDKLHTFTKDISEIFPALEAEKFDVIIDLHKNLRSSAVKRHLKIRSYTFDKINLRKFMAVNFKMLGLLPPKHIVDRYFEAITPLGIQNDEKGLDHYLSAEDHVDLTEFSPQLVGKRFLALVVGGSYYTKKIPVEKLWEICSIAKVPVVLVGGKDDEPIASELCAEFTDLINTCGAFSINQSASVIQQSEWVITSDTGLMHIAAAFNKKIFSAWGNTIPEFGMSPYRPQSDSRPLEVNDLPCRPCSKLGYHQCPLAHFKCMRDIDYNFVKDLL